MRYSKFKVFKDKNIGGRDSQQDDYYSEYNEALDKLIMVVADGMGGHKGGQIASEIVVKKTKQFFQDKSNENLSAHEFFEKLIPSIHKSIVKRGLKENISPHTTIVIAIVQNGYIEYAHIGDSRLYIFTEEEQLVERTRDHSVPEMLFQMGEISEDDMATHPDQNKLTKSLGGERVESFTFKRHKIDSSKNYAIVLCSDGLWEYFTDAQMYKALFKMNLALDDIGNKMILRAKKIGDPNGDNITLVFTKIPATKNTNSLSRLSKFNIQWILMGLLLILLTIGVYFLLSPLNNNEKKKIIPKIVSEDIKKESPLVNDIQEEVNTVSTEREINKKWKALHDIIINGMITMEEKDDSIEKVKEYIKFFKKYKNKFNTLIREQYDKVISREYHSLVKKAKSKYDKKDFAGSISVYYSILSLLVDVTLKQGEDN